MVAGGPLRILGPCHDICQVQCRVCQSSNDYSTRPGQEHIHPDWTFLQ